MIKIIPAILTDNPTKLQEMILKAEDVVDSIQIDVIDGKFADNVTIDPRLLKDIDTNLKLDFHLMVKNPINWIEKCVHVSTDRIIGHIEMMPDQVEFVGKVTEAGLKVGLAIDLSTPVSKLDPAILTNLDVVLVMSVPAGFGGQKFDQKALNKIKKLDEIRVRDDTPYAICEDGGITFDNIDDARVSGVDEVSIGQRLFKGSLDNNIKRYIKSAYK